MKGATLQMALGHASFETTRKHYLSVTTEDLRREHELHGPLDGLGGMLKRGAPVQLPGAVRSQLPAPDVLAREIAASNYRAVARRYGCSDTLLRKKLKKAGLLP
jgi:hypothetical protein